MEGHDTPFAASIAVYPYCKSGPLDSNTPSLILIGEKDDWALPSACSFYMPGEAGYYLEDKPKHEVILKIYPGAYHDFNWPDVESVPGHILTGCCPKPFLSYRRKIVIIFLI